MAKQACSSRTQYFSPQEITKELLHRMEDKTDLQEALEWSIRLAEEQDEAREIQTYMEDENDDDDNNNDAQKELKINTDSKLWEHEFLVYTLFRWAAKTRAVNTCISPSDDKSVELWSAGKHNSSTHN